MKNRIGTRIKSGSTASVNVFLKYFLPINRNNRVYELQNY
ncbi:hypothetical protein FORC58_0197 [Salmonella enterica subsp. enterica serovar Typhimurium]|nr:hypothetical protein FORC58_0197 [Salmonella enterica subsp. enterica serovar Typhimurium]